LFSPFSSSSAVSDFETSIRPSVGDVNSESVRGEVGDVNENEGEGGISLLAFGDFGDLVA